VNLWDISISGNAATASTAGLLNGQSASALSVAYAANAGLHNGYPLQTADAVPGAHQVVMTDGGGYIKATYFYSSVGAAEKNASSPPYVWGTNGSDNYMRTYATSSLQVYLATYATYVYSNIGYVQGYVGTGGSTIAVRDASGNVSAVGFYSSSSKKLKEHIKALEFKALDIINKVNIVSYNFIADENKINKIGFIAEDTDELLSTPNHDSMDTTNTLSLLLKAVQELFAEIKILKAKG
jgi:hypothetical protein